MLARAMASSADASRIASALSDVASRVAAAAGRRAAAVASSSSSLSASATSTTASPSPPLRLPRLVAVSKTKPVEDLQAAYDAGHRDFGENYVQELLDKAHALPSDIRWRFIGHLQSNKAAALVKGVPGLACVETVDSIKLATKLDAAVAAAAAASEASPHVSSPLPVFVQVNTSGEESKHGVEPSAAATLASEIRAKCPNLRVAGLMTIGQPDYSSRPENFACLSRVRDDVARALGIEDAEKELDLSMGMSGDFEAAIEMGSTNVRVGSTIFGARNYG